MMWRLIVCQLIFLLAICQLFSQKTPDSLAGKEYDYLRNGFIANYVNRDLAYLYAYSFLNKAKREGIAEKIAFGYHLVSLSVPNEIEYIDSLIDFTKNKSIPRYPVSGYMLKGQFYYDQLEYKKTLDLFLLADSLLSKGGDNDLLYECKRMIAVLKARIGNHREALGLYKDVLNHADSVGSSYDYSTTAFAIAESYNFLNKPDSAEYFIKKARKKNRASNNGFDGYFTVSSVATQYNKNNYSGAIDSANASYDFLINEGDLPNIAFIKYYKAKALSALGRENESIVNYKEVDSIFLLTEDIHPELRDSWEKLIEHYESRNDIANELKYVKRLLSVDSILTDNYKYLNNNINRKYDFPQLVQLKDSLIEKYRNKNRVFSIRNTYLLLGLIVVIGIFIAYWIKEREKIKSFRKIIDELEGKKRKIQVSQNGALPLAKEIYEKIDEKMTALEEKEFYLDNHMTLSKASKRCGYNNKYVSMYINHSKKKNFTQYLNDLRIDYTLKRFKENKIFRNYALSSVAKEVGFNSTEYFSKAFKKRTDISPTFFLKQLSTEG